MEFFDLPTEHAGGEKELVALSPDHPGFNDPEYRNRRDRIAALALQHKPGREIPLAGYSPQENAVWKQVSERLLGLHGQHVCREVLALQDLVPLGRERVPQLREVNDRLVRIAGFSMEPVAGLVSPRTFLSYLGKRVFLSTQYIRHHSMPFYTPEPDIIHELVGHAATLAHPGIAEVNRLLGKASVIANGEEMLRLSRMYWYTMEFGLVEQAGQTKAFGAGLLSSASELEGYPRNADLKSWDLDRIAATPYDPTAYQAQLFVAPSFTRLLTDTSCWLRLGEWRDEKAQGKGIS
jgi:phenylalanine-4-hydroxylase